MRALIAVVIVFGCDKKPAPTNPAPVVPDAAAVPVAIDAATAVAPIDAAPAKPTFTETDPLTLPLIPVKAGKGAKQVTIYAMDMDGGRLLAALAFSNRLSKPIEGKTFTGRIENAARQEAYEAVAAHLGVDITPTKFKGRGATIDFSFHKAPVADLLRILADVGRVNIIAPGKLGEVDITAKRVPWDGALDEIAKIENRTVTAAGNTRYVLTAGTKLPPLPKIASKVRVDLDIKDGTMTHALAVLRELTPVSLGACDGGTFSLRVRNVTLAEALRALSIASGTTLAENPTCKSEKLAGGPIDALRLVAIASVGTKRAAVFDRAGVVLTTTKEGSVTDIGMNYVSFDETAIQLYSWPTENPDDAKAWMRKLRRTLAIVSTGSRRYAYVDTDDGMILVENGHRLASIPEDVRIQVDRTRVYVEYQGQTVAVMMGRYN